MINAIILFAKKRKREREIYIYILEKYHFIKINFVIK